MRAPDRWPELEGYSLHPSLMKNMYWTRQAAKAWHVHLSTWMEEHGYLPVNNEKTIFMRWEEDDFIIHGVFVDDFATFPTCPEWPHFFVSNSDGVPAHRLADQESPAWPIRKEPLLFA